MEASAESQGRRGKTLSDMACRSAKAGPRLAKLSDSGGLQLWVQPNGSKLWRLAYRFGGKQKLLALGAYPQVSLAEARSKRDEAKKQLREGRDPSEVRKQDKAAQAEAVTTFRDVAEEYLAKKKREGRAQTTMTKLEWLMSFAYPVLGQKAIKDIRPIDVLPVLQEVEKRGRIETARRLAAARFIEQPLLGLGLMPISIYYGPQFVNRLLNAHSYSSPMGLLSGSGCPTIFVAWSFCDVNGG